MYLQATCRENKEKQEEHWQRLCSKLASFLNSQGAQHHLHYTEFVCVKMANGPKVVHPMWRNYAWQETI